MDDRLENEEGYAPEEQLPMDVVLSEIRKMLMADVQNGDADENKKDISQSLSDVRKDICFSNEEDTSDYFLLTPGMRCDVDLSGTDPVLSETVQRRTQMLLDKLSRQKKDDPEIDVQMLSESIPNDAMDKKLVDWLDRNLPEMLEKIVAKELQKVILKK